ncbi:MAG TPA: hypothetical protein VJZ06_07340 [Mobilitalea sp.]|nr:hypothetical protein [Mobilitalea sp.]
MIKIERHMEDLRKQLNLLLDQGNSCSDDRVLEVSSKFDHALSEYLMTIKQ